MRSAHRSITRARAGLARATRTWRRAAACRARPRTGRRASPASGSGTSARRRSPAPRARRGRTGSRRRAGSGGPGGEPTTNVERPSLCGVDAAGAVPLRPPAGRSDDQPLDVLADDRLRVGAEPFVGDEAPPPPRGGAIRLKPAHSPLRVVGDDDELLGRSDQRPVGLRLEQVRRREAGVLGHAVDAHEQHVDVQRPERGHGDRPDERVRRRAHAAGQHDGQVRPRLAVQHDRHLHRVGDDRQVGDVGQVVGEPPRRRAGAERRSPGPGSTRPRAASAIASFSGELPARLGLEARLVGAEAAAGGRAAVDLVDQPGAGEHVEVAPDRHVRHRRAAPVSSLTRTAPRRRSSSDDQHAGVGRRACSTYPTPSNTESSSRAGSTSRAVGSLTRHLHGPEGFTMLVRQSIVVNFVWDSAIASLPVQRRRSMSDDSTLQLDPADPLGDAAADPPLGAGHRRRRPRRGVRPHRRCSADADAVPAAVAAAVREGLRHGHVRLELLRPGAEEGARRRSSTASRTRRA